MIDTKKIIRWILFLSGFVILFLFIFTLDIKEVQRGFSRITLEILLIVTALNFLNILLKAIRWQMLVYWMTNIKPSLIFSFGSIIAGVSAGSLTPGRGTEVAKPMMLKISDNISFTKSIPAMVIERVIDMLTIIFALFVTFLLIQKRTAVYNQLIIPVALITLFVIICMFIIPKKIEKLILRIMNKFPLSNNIQQKSTVLIKSFFEGLAIVKEKRMLLWLSVLSLGAYILEIIRLHYIFTMFGVKIPFMLVGFSLTAAIIFALITLIPGGIGITEISFVAILVSLLPTYRAESYSTPFIVDRILTYYLLIVIGAFILMIYKKKKR